MPGAASREIRKEYSSMTAAERWTRIVEPTNAATIPTNAMARTRLDVVMGSEPGGLFTSSHTARECAGLTGGDLRVKVSPGQSLSRQAGTKSCGRRGNAGSEA